MQVLLSEPPDPSPETLYHTPLECFKLTRNSLWAASACFTSNGLPVIRHAQHKRSQSATHMLSANMLTTAQPVLSHYATPFNATRCSFETVRSDELAGVYTDLWAPVGGYALPSRPFSPPKEDLDDNALLEQLLAGDVDSGLEAPAQDVATGADVGVGSGFQKPSLGPKLLDDTRALSTDDVDDAPGGGDDSGDADWRPCCAPTGEDAACGLRKRPRNGGGCRTAEEKRRDRRCALQRTFALQLDTFSVSAVQRRCVCRH